MTSIRAVPPTTDAGWLSADSDLLDGNVPTVRAVLLNYNGGDMVLRAVESVLSLDWPQSRLEVVVVDNNSHDGSDTAIEARFPTVQVLRNETNEGFPGNNSALTDLTGIDHVLLVNSDAFPNPDLLRRLVAAIGSDPAVGAVGPKIVLEPTFLNLSLRTRASQPGGADTRSLGVAVTGVEVAATGDGGIGVGGGAGVGVDAAEGIRRWDDQWSSTVFGPGCHGRESGPADRPGLVWTGDRAEIRIPVEKPARVRVRLSALSIRTVELDGGAGVERIEVTTDPEWFEVGLGGTPFDIINNAGSMLLPDGSGADRGFHELDDGRFDVPCDVFAWCGAAVLLRRQYLESTGLFDPSYFMYYEDFDLAWRALAHGWRHRYEPSAITRHIHAATSVEGSDLFAYHVERNRLATLIKNAPGPLVRSALVRYVTATASYTKRDIIGPLRRRRRPVIRTVRRRLKAFAGLTPMLPRLIRQRRLLRRMTVLSDERLQRYLDQPDSHRGVMP